MEDWVAWHEPYDQPGSPLHRRLAIVQDDIRSALDRRPPGLVRAVSVCAGQGRDLIGVLADHPRGTDVTARLVEMDPHNVDTARTAAAAAGLTGVDVVVGDAGITDVYCGAVPADLVLVCGVFGNITDDDIASTIAALPQLCAPGATVFWTRHRRPPDFTPTIRGWFDDAGFEEVAFHAPDDDEGLFFSVGATAFRGQPKALEPGHRLFTFVGFDALSSS